MYEAGGPASNGNTYWTRAKDSGYEYIIPVRLDNSYLEGIPDTHKYIDQRTNADPIAVATKISTRLKRSSRLFFLPPAPGELFRALEILHNPYAQSSAMERAGMMLASLRAMSAPERMLVLMILANGCPHDLRQNVHIELDVLADKTGLSAEEIGELLVGMDACVFEALVGDADVLSTISKSHDTQSHEFVGLSWSEPSDSRRTAGMTIPYEMVSLVVQKYCEEHGMNVLETLDFSQLAEASRDNP